MSTGVHGCVCLSRCVFDCVWVCMVECVWLYVWVSVLVLEWLCLCVCGFECLSVCVFDCVWVSLSVCLSGSLCVSLFVCVGVAECLVCEGVGSLCVSGYRSVWWVWLLYGIVCFSLVCVAEFVCWWVCVRVAQRHLDPYPQTVTKSHIYTEKKRHTDLPTPDPQIERESYRDLQWNPHTHTQSQRKTHSQTDIYTKIPKDT